MKEVLAMLLERSSSPFHILLSCAIQNNLALFQAILVCMCLTYCFPLLLCAAVMAGRKYETLSKKWLLIIILTPAALFTTGLAVLLVWACCKRRGKSNLTPGMLIWTNQSTLQRRLDCELSPESFST